MTVEKVILQEVFLLALRIGRSSLYEIKPFESSGGLATGFFPIVGEMKMEERVRFDLSSDDLDFLREARAERLGIAASHLLQSGYEVEDGWRERVFWCGVSNCDPGTGTPFTATADRKLRRDEGESPALYLRVGKTPEDDQGVRCWFHTNRETWDERNQLADQLAGDGLPELEARKRAFLTVRPFVALGDAFLEVERRKWDEANPAFAQATKDAREQAHRKSERVRLCPFAGEEWATNCHGGDAVKNLVGFDLPVIQELAENSFDTTIKYVADGLLNLISEYQSDDGLPPLPCEPCGRRLTLGLPKPALISALRVVTRVFRSQSLEEARERAS
jgi:hypothetical protein